MRDVDWDNMYYSEVFRNYVMGELKKEAEEKEETDHKIENSKNILDDVDEMERKIHANVELLNKFKVIQAKLIDDPSFYDKTDKKFAEVVLMLDLDHSED